MNENTVKLDLGYSEIWKVRQAGQHRIGAAIYIGRQEVLTPLIAIPTSTCGI